VPGNLTEAINALEKSPVAWQAFGDGVVEHYLHSAQLERQSFDNVVTDWELRRNFERVRGEPTRRELRLPVSGAASVKEAEQ
jgi:glutamine synthetase